MRYQITAGSVSGHCCFEATVWDTNKPVMHGDKHYQDKEHGFHYETVCECFGVEEAVKIARALNEV